MFTLSFSSAEKQSSTEDTLQPNLPSPAPGEATTTATSHLKEVKPAKRTRRRRNQQRPKMTQVEPMQPDVNKTCKQHKSSPAKKHHDAPMTKSDLYFALDCEMVGVGEEGLDSAVARVTIVNWENDICLDTFVQVPVPVTDYRTHVSGVSSQSLANARPFELVREQVETILRGKILIGHALENDLFALRLTHPWCDVRDTALYAPYMQMDPRSGLTRPRRLRDLCWEHLGRCIQLEGRPHSPIEDAIAALDLYKAARNEWEEYLMQQQKDHNGKPPFAAAPLLQQYNPYAQQIPEIAYAFPYQQEQQSRQQHQHNNYSWFWTRRAKSPSGRSSPVPEEPMEPVAGENLEYSQRTDTTTSSSRSSWSFFQRRPRSSSSIIQSCGTADTEVSTDHSWAPDYTYLQETSWSQSFQIQEGQRARLGSEDVLWSQRTEDPWDNRQKSNTEETWQQTRSNGDDSWEEWREGNYALLSNYLPFSSTDWNTVAYPPRHEHSTTMESHYVEPETK